MKVSVSIITYNHEEFIAQAIESVLMQKTNFDYEILIGEDDSSDNTRAIVKAYKEKCPAKIRLFLNDRKDVIYIDGKPTGRWNLINNLQHTQGQYVALLDGDDYWVSPHKLQKQVDYLDSHPDAAICFHSVKKIYADNSRKPEISTPRGRKRVYYLKDLLKGKLMTTCSIMFRNGLFDQFPEWYYSAPIGDKPLSILNAQYGNIGYIDQVMAVYRIHSGAIWSVKDEAQKARRVIKLYEAINQHLDFQYDNLIRSRIYYCHCQIAQAEGRRREALENLFKCIATSPFNPSRPPRRLILQAAKLFFPHSYKLFKSGKEKWLP